MLPTLSVRTAALWRLTPCLLLLGLAACESESASRRGRMSGIASGAAAPAPVPDLEAHAMFFAGQIEVEVLSGRGEFAPRDPSNGATGSGRGGGGFSLGGGSGRRGGGGAGRRGGGGGEPAPSGSPRTNDDGTPVLHLPVSNLPPVRLHLRLTNHGTEPVEVEVTDFNSDLGNFVVQPAKILLPSGESVEANPMTSRLGFSADEIALTVTMRVSGKVEKQVLVLRLVPPAASSAATTPSAPVTALPQK